MSIGNLRDFSSEEAMAHFAAIVESSEDAIISKTLDGTVLTWNAGAGHVYGYPAAEAIGQAMTFLLPEDRPDEESVILQRIARGERVEHFETVRRTKRGDLIDVSLTISPIRGGSGRIIGASHVARNISERKRLDEQLRHTQKLESLGLLAGGIAHDFNNLLTGILGNTSLALETLSPHNPPRSVLRDVLNASERASHLTCQLLAYMGQSPQCAGVRGPTFVMRVIAEARCRQREARTATAETQPVETRQWLRLPGSDSQSVTYG